MTKFLYKYRRWISFGLILVMSIISLVAQSNLYTLITCVALGFPYWLIIDIILREMFLISVSSEINALLNTTKLQDDIEKCFMPSRRYQIGYLVLCILTLIYYLLTPLNDITCIIYIISWAFVGVMLLYYVIKFYYRQGKFKSSKKIANKMVNNLNFLGLIETPVIEMISIMGIELTAMSLTNQVPNFIIWFIYFTTPIGVLFSVDKSWRNSFSKLCSNGGDRKTEKRYLQRMMRQLEKKNNK